MFDLLKQDVKVGNKVKLYLVTGKEPEGVVLEIGENFILLEVEDSTRNRFFDKLIGGWDILINPIEVPQKEKSFRLSKIMKQMNVDMGTIIEFLKSKGIIVQHNPNAKIEQSIYDLIKLEIEDFKKNETIHDINELDLNLLIESANLLKHSIDKETLSKSLEPNANIIDVRGTTCIAANNDDPSILIFNNKIIDEKLISEIETFQIGSIIPVVLNIFKKEDKLITNAVALPDNLLGYINSFISLIEKGNYEQARLLVFIIRKFTNSNKHLWTIINEFKRTNQKILNKEPKKISTIEVNSDQKKAFKNVEKEINDLIRKSNFDFALSQIEKELTNSAIEDKYKSSLLLKKAQIYSSMNNPESSEKAYQELVELNENIKSPSNNLSHLYTELARLQALKPETTKQAIISVKKALNYNSNNNYASNLLKQLEGKKAKETVDLKSINNIDEHILLDVVEDSSAISKMIDLDIKEHRYTHSEIIKNGGKPTAFIAGLILKETRDSGGNKVTENYPAFLEAAKAFSELNVGSYELRDYQESVAYYSMLKGNSLFNEFRNELINGNLNSENLYRLNESASDYYIETLNILSNIDSKLLVSVLTNYIQLKVARFYLETSIDFDYKYLFQTKFSTLFNTCVWSKEINVKIIAFRTIIEIGSNSLSMWNKLNGIFQSEIKFKSIFDMKSNKEIINSLLKSKFNLEVSASNFLKNAFQFQKTQIISFRNKIDNFLKIEFIPINFRILNDDWKVLLQYSHLQQKTDIEIYENIQSILDIIQPYLDRGERERGNILITISKSIQYLIDFINSNTTFYGRTFYYRVLENWEKSIDLLLVEKIEQSLPQLEITMDPPYLLELNGDYFAPLIIKNTGEATAESAKLYISCESIIYEGNVEIPLSIDVEIAANQKIETNFLIPKELLSESEAVEVKINIQPTYQKRQLNFRIFEFTVEKEPDTFLTPEDIPWKIGNSTPENLFFGRKPLIDKLKKHYKSTNRDNPYILYGLTRTGKSSILEYLRKSIIEDTILIENKAYKFIAFEWQLQEISNNVNARDFYEDILIERTYNELKKLLINNNQWDYSFTCDDKGKFGDFKRILQYAKLKGYYSMFFVDEFSYIQDLMDKGIIGKSFLAALREYSLTGLSSFIFAGTYDIKKLITEEKYGITGQLVHVIEYQVDKIEDEDAEDLICIINDKLSFTPEAINHIKYLSGNIPYFIQIICKNCGDYAVENHRRYIGYPELEKVIRLLTGEDYDENSIIVRLPHGVFQNNQYSTTDPKEVGVLMSTLSYFNRGKLLPRGVGSYELEQFWHEKGLISFKSNLAKSIQSLMERKIITEFIDDEIPVYKFSVDIFRRWWLISHQDINLEIATLKNEL